MRSRNLHQLRVDYEDGAFREEVVWLLPTAVQGSSHNYKYRLVYIVASKRIIGFDNERDKGDHMHINGEEAAYQFMSLTQLFADFREFVRRERSKHGKTSD